MAETGKGGKARYFCPAEGCHTDTLKKWRYGYMHDVDLLICYEEKIMIRQDITGYDLFVISQNYKDFHLIF